MKGTLVVVWVLGMICLAVMGERPGVCLLGGLFTALCCHIFAESQS